MRTRALLPLVLVVGGCAAQPGARPSPDELDLEQKQEALVGAACIDDSGCDAWEFCDTRVCIPGVPCPPDGHCVDVSRWYDNEGAAIPDADPAGVTRVIRVARPDSTVARMHLSLNIAHTWRGDLRVVLTSPAGTAHVLHDRTGGSARDLAVHADLTSIFEGETAVGEWRLTVADLARRDVGRILAWSIELDYTEAPAPEVGRDVWARVEVPSIESAHPYANDFDQTWDLRPFSGGAARARIRFSRLETERRYDFVEVIDLSTGAVLDRFDGRLGAFTTREYETGDLGIRLVTDYSVTAWGFAMEYVEVFGLGCLGDEDCPTGTQCPNEVVRCIRFPCFLSCVPDTAGGEGAPCATNLDCGEDLFCGADRTCRADGTCASGDVTECHMPGNDWYHILCVGQSTCDAGSCGWRCGPPPICAEAEITDDGCNVCTCEDGAWSCTERYCPRAGAEGDACGSAAGCAPGLMCDRGRTVGPTCGFDQAGICVRDEPTRICTREVLPVCACNGQTFQNECGRIGVAPYAHEGECLLDVAIPDANATGITRTLDVIAPANGASYSVTVRIDHTWRGDLVVYLDDPDGNRRVLTNREGGSAQNFEFHGSFRAGASGGLGTYRLHVSDRASRDVGVLRFFNVLVH
ncbi:MAG: proprotein convertase P-domain-containing protein [Sandaracinaceae bacterium]|nr:proprotein convertase P-domain-containing protein [Sandaracinaceae bacterium]